jgi:hypothetical protein
MHLLSRGVWIDTQRGLLPGLSRERKLRSKIWWFTEFCNSHYVSHFAAFFIGTRAKISIVKSCVIVWIICINISNKKEQTFLSMSVIGYNLEGLLVWKKERARFGELHCISTSSVNDPSAGSPTETLLRLLLPLNEQVWSSFRPDSVLPLKSSQSLELTNPFNR